MRVAMRGYQSVITSRWLLDCWVLENHFVQLKTNALQLRAMYESEADEGRGGEEKKGGGAKKVLMERRRL